MLQVLFRLERGADLHRDRNLIGMPLESLLDEILEELADVAGWAALAHARIRRLWHAAAGAELRIKHKDDDA